MEVEQIKQIYLDGHDDGYAAGFEMGMLKLSGKMMHILVDNLPDDPVKRVDIYSDTNEAMKSLLSEFSDVKD